jgi:hypothetical protein
MVVCSSAPGALGTETDDNGVIPPLLCRFATAVGDIGVCQDEIF